MTRPFTNANAIALILLPALLHGLPVGADMLGDTYEDTHRIEPPDDPDQLPSADGAEPAPDRETGTPVDAEPADQAPASSEDIPADAQSPDEEATGTGPDGTDGLDDTYEDTIRIGPEGETRDTDTAADPAAQVEQQMEEEGAGTARAPAEERDTAWMHHFDHFGLYGQEQSDGGSGLEGIYLEGYRSAAATRPGATHWATQLSADIPVGADEDGLGEAYLGVGGQAGTDRLTLFATVGAAYARTVRSTGTTQSDTDWAADAGIRLRLATRTMATVAVREDPNELIDDRTARIGIHLGPLYVGMRHRLDADISRADLAIRF